MSHFVTAVFARKPEDVHDLMAPYNESVDHTSPYAVFKENEECEVDQTTGKRGYWHNPNARWDYWMPGGGWSTYLRLLPGKKGWQHIEGQKPALITGPGRCDQALACDCDTSMDEKEYKDALRAWERLVEGSPAIEGEKPLLQLWKPEYYLNRYGSKENYAKNMASLLPYAFVTEYGVWHEMGHMGWFGFDDATFESISQYTAEFEAQLEQAKQQGMHIIILDCHI